MAETRLGCPETRVLIMNRCSSQTICDITDQISSVAYGRVLDDTSEARISLNLSSDGIDSVCCKCIGDTRSWLHSILIKRDEEPVWFGPIVDLLYGSEIVDIVARDVTAWLDVRVIHNAYNFTNENVLDIARTIIQDALQPDDPCNLFEQLGIFRPTPETQIDKQYTVAQDYVGELLRDLAKTVIDYTAVGGRILIAEALEFGPYVTLRDEDFQTNLEVEERGIEAATKWYVKGSGVLGQAGGVDSFMGLIEQLASDDRITSTSQANAGATGRLRASNPPPVYINVPSGAQLSADAPFPFRQLVPGTLVNLDLRNICRPMRAQHRLTAVSVTVDDTGTEKVGITLSPPGTAFQEAGGIEQP